MQARPVPRRSAARCPTAQRKKSGQACTDIFPSRQLAAEGRYTATRCRRKERAHRSTGCWSSPRLPTPRRTQKKAPPGRRKRWRCGVWGREEGGALPQAGSLTIVSWFVVFRPNVLYSFGDCEMPLGAHGLPDHPTPASSGSFFEVERSESRGQMITDCFAPSLARQRQSIFRGKICYTVFAVCGHGITHFPHFSHDFGESSRFVCLFVFKLHFSRCLSIFLSIFGYSGETLCFFKYFLQFTAVLLLFSGHGLQSKSSSVCCLPPLFPLVVFETSLAFALDYGLVLVGM